MITTPEDITVEWLNTCLSEAGHGDTPITSFAAKPIGTGQLGECVRLTLAGNTITNGGTAPATLVAKLPSTNPTSRATGVALRSYIKEVRFYQELQHRLSIRTPICYFADIDGEGPDFVLLLEDLAPAVQGDQLGGCSVVEADAAVQQLVGLHAPTWNDASLRDVEWLGVPDPDSIELVRGLYQGQLAAFLDRFGSGLTTDQAGVISALGAAADAPPFSLLPENYSAVHTDYRLDNVLIDSTPATPTVAAVDWQGVRVGQPLSDVAYFLGAGLLAEERRGAERAIVDAYHQRLTEAGVAGYDAATCWDDYRRGTFSGLIVTVIAALLVEQTERGDAMFAAMAERHSQHVLDLDALEFLS